MSRRALAAPAARFAAPLRVALPPPVASAHRARASLRACRGLGQSPKALCRSTRAVSVASVRKARREASALWAVGPKAQSDPKRTGGKRQPGGLLRAAQSDPQVRRREASALWAVAAKGGKATRRREQIQGLRAVSAQNADICERANTRAARGQRAERRYLRTSKYKGCARPARRTPIFAKGREARMIEQPGRKKRGAPGAERTGGRGVRQSNV